MKTKISRRQIMQQSLLGMLVTCLPLSSWAKLKKQLRRNKMKTTIHRSNTRGAANHGWLKSQHSFSFASYYNPERMGFGLLRVINDDIVDPAQGFGTHPHQDMEIVSIPLSGALRHKDSEGNQAVIKHGEVQLMSAGTGVYHSEYNDSSEEDVNFLQIWVLPEKKGITPRYDQKAFQIEERQNKWQIVVSPMDKDDQGVKINQQAWFSLVDLEQKKTIQYKTHNPKNGVYFFVLTGELDIAGEKLHQRDAIGIEDFSKVELKATAKTSLLAIEVPMV